MTRFSIVSQRSRVTVEVQSTLRRIDLESTRLGGEFEAILRDGRLEASAATGTFSVPALSVVSGNWLIDRDVKVMLEARKFPEIVGTLLEIKTAGDGGQYQLRGTLRLHGVTREVQGQATIVELTDRRAVISGEMKLDYTQFNLIPPKLLMLSVEPEVMIRGRVHAEFEP
jgi:polyisoprenoid-binding protein YceI